ncbi:recombination protein O N-terminal domain-containing protein [Fenollaria sporofastidiosus]|uniref:recombination protein O N-terminal domain-containing protein n=1 Tax=Fenollaria sporofastidiosus TaxID=2811778 RepID=UPI001C003105|nr:recombination protein O N-terminal domain-containing protein [Fenollaria sporofastidiosus]
MDTSKSEEYRGIVIASKSDEKNGKILEIYTVNAGRIKAYVRSAYDLRSNVSRSSFVFTESVFMLSKYKELFLVNDSKVLYSAQLMNADIKRFTILLFIRAIINAFEYSGVR